MKMKLYIVATTTALVALWLTSCGGTFSLSPAGVVSYTTPEILKAPIVYQK